MTRLGSVFYTWDVRGNLASVSGGGSAFSFTYDSFGRRLTKSLVGSGTTSYKFWDGWGDASAFASGEGANALEYLNAQGSVERQKGTGGSPDRTFSYAPYGAVTSAQPAGTDVTQSRWAGMEPDRSDLYYARYRYYHPHLGRFVSEDPIGLAGGMNLYAYVGGDPVNFTDPMGLSPVSLFGTDFEFDAGVWQRGLATSAAALGAAASDIATGTVNSAIDAAAAAPYGPAGPAMMAVWKMTGGGPPHVPSLYDGGPYKCQPGFGFSKGAWNVAITALTLRAGLRGGCFPAGTPVRMADGTTRPIEQVKEGDLVLSRDAATGRTGAHRVSAVSVRASDELVTVALADSTTGKVVETMRATPEHPFFVEGRGWVELGQVGIGSQVVTRAGPNLVVQSLTRERFEQGVTVYNFEVEGTHSYFVGTALGGAWVHNTCSLFDWGRAGHIFRPAPGHVNPLTSTSRQRFARLFESVGSDPANLRTDAVASGLITPHASAAGVTAYTKVMRNGRQVWVHVRGGTIQNAGINPLGLHR